MTAFLLGMALMAVLAAVSDRLGDQHPVSKVGSWSPVKRLTHIIPQPVHIGYGMPFGLLGVWGLPAALLFGFLYEHFGRPQDNVVGFEVEDVRDVVLGALIGWGLTAL